MSGNGHVAEADIGLQSAGHADEEQRLGLEHADGALGEHGGSLVSLPGLGEGDDPW
ncbi:hypothetical protein [Streptomyces sp. F001]|uniref:hypothetical protein n=1 Tax=Streptomyces sp. F001 TaxID=1510026 RepID=UPI001F114655|nr:hypothetical protein [Streptomyces sp. F001]